MFFSVSTGYYSVQEYIHRLRNFTTNHPRFPFKIRLGVLNAQKTFLLFVRTKRIMYMTTFMYTRYCVLLNTRTTQRENKTRRRRPVS